MKTRLNITIEHQLLERMKIYAVKEQVSLSALIEAYFRKILKRNSEKKNLLEMIDGLDPDPKIVAASYGKEARHETISN